MRSPVFGVASRLAFYLIDESTPKTHIALVEYGTLPWRSCPLWLGKAKRERFLIEGTQFARSIGLTVTRLHGNGFIEVRGDALNPTRVYGRKFVRK